MSATAKFYTGLALVLVVIVGASFGIGYKVGSAHARAHAAVRAHAAP